MFTPSELRTHTSASVSAGEVPTGGLGSGGGLGNQGALALDDERTTFHPVLWTEEGEAAAAAGADGIMGGPAPFAKADRSRFLQALDEALARLERRG